MKAVIMAGGEGLRLRPATGEVPKPMALLGGRPMLEHILVLLKRNGIDHVCMSLRYRPDVIMDHFGSGEAFGIKIEYHVESEPLGTAGGVKACPKKFTERDFLVISGDCACDFDLRQLMEAHRRHGAAVTMALYSHETPLQYGTVLTDTRGRIVSFTEKPQWHRVVSDLVNTGIYVASPEAMELVPEGRPFDFAGDLFPRLMLEGKELRGLIMEGYWCDIGTPRAYYRCNLDALDGRLKLPLSVPEKKAPAPPPTHHKGCASSVPCRSRARFMRIISQQLMEAGADFTDGIRLKNEYGEVHIHPDAAAEALIVDASSKNPRNSAKLSSDICSLLKTLEEN